MYMYMYMYVYLLPSLPCYTEVSMFPALHEDTELLCLGGLKETVARGLHHGPALNMKVRVRVEVATTLLDHVCHILRKKWYTT
jgi:hypothetical protein